MGGRTGVGSRPRKPSNERIKLRTLLQVLQSHKCLAREPTPGFISVQSASPLSEVRLQIAEREQRLEERRMAEELILEMLPAARRIAVLGNADSRFGAA